MAAAAGDAHPYPIYNARFRVTFPILDADGDLVTGAAGLDSEASQDQGTFADCTNEATEIATSSGIYFLDLISTELDTMQTAVIVKTSTSGAKTTPIVLYPKRLPVLETGTAQAGGGSTITLASSASAQDNYYNGCYANITNNTPTNALGQARKIIGYVGSTRVATVEAAWGTNPSSSSTYEILLADSIADVVQWIGVGVAPTDTAGYPKVTIKSGTGTGEISLSAGVVNTVGAVTGAVGSVTGNVGGNVVGNVNGNVVGSVGSVVGAVGSVTGNVGGNVVGSVGSVTGNVGGNVVGTVASVVGNVGGNVVGSVGSVVGAVGSVTGNVGGNLIGNVNGNVVGSVGSVTGAVGSVTGNVGGNVVGSVGSVTGNVGGNVVGTVASVVGNVGGNVVGSVGSVVGAVGSVTGNVGGNVNGNVVGSVGSVTGAVGSVTGSVGGNLGGSVLGGVAGSVGSVVTAVTTTAADQQASADELLNRNLAGGGSGGARIVRDAFRRLRNRVAIVAGVVTVYQENDTTAAWTGAVTTTPSDPVSQVDPA